MAFAEIVEDVQKLSYDELQELKILTDKYIIEMERDRIYQSHLESINEYEEGKLKGSSKINELKKMLDNL